MMLVCTSFGIEGVAQGVRRGIPAVSESREKTTYRIRQDLVRPAAYSVPGNARRPTAMHVALSSTTHPPIDLLAMKQRRSYLRETPACLQRRRALMQVLIYRVILQLNGSVEVSAHGLAQRELWLVKPSVQSEPSTTRGALATQRQFHPKQPALL